MTAIPATAPQDIPVPPQLDTYNARELIQHGATARIVLDGTAYYLRITRAGKLILTK